MTETLGSLCAGYGGLEIGLEMAGYDINLAWYSETADAPSKVMATHHDAPNLGDLCAIGTPPPVDIATAGFPCQPVSNAGRREGVDDDRWLIDDVCRVARAAGARTLILENVAGLLTANDGDAMAAVCAAMAREGFSRWEWRTLRASDVGAPHQRKRWFCIAVSDAFEGGRLGRPRVKRGRPGGRTLVGGPGEDTGDAHGEPRRQSRKPGPGASEGGRTLAIAAGPDRVSSDADGATFGTESVSESGSRDTAVAGPDSDATAHSYSERLQDERPDRVRTQQSHIDRRTSERFGGYAEAIARWEPIVGRPAPDPTRDGRLSPAFVEWMMGLPAEWVTGCDLTRPEMLGVLGNGVVPHQAAAAIRSLDLRSYD